MLSTEDIDRVSFTETKWREGYDKDEVDAFLVEVRASIAAGPSATGVLGAVDILSARFQPTKFRLGYHQDEVDDFLDRALATLRAYGR